jgi:hypothetical protein
MLNELYAHLGGVQRNALKVYGKKLSSFISVPYLNRLVL